MCDPKKLKNSIISINFDENYIMLGIEVLDASKHLPKELLDMAEKI